MLIDAVGFNRIQQDASGYCRMLSDAGRCKQTLIDAVGFTRIQQDAPGYCRMLSDAARCWQM